MGYAVAVLALAVLALAAALWTVHRQLTDVIVKLIQQQGKQERVQKRLVGALRHLYSKENVLRLRVDVHEEMREDMEQVYEELYS